MKLKTVYICQNCSFQTSKWAGKCSDCGTWNSLIEDVINVGKAAKSSSIVRKSTGEKPRAISLKTDSKKRLNTGIKEWDQLLGGGMVWEAWFCFPVNLDWKIHAHSADC